MSRRVTRPIFSMSGKIESRSSPISRTKTGRPRSRSRSIVRSGLPRKAMTRSGASDWMSSEAGIDEPADLGLPEGGLGEIAVPRDAGDLLFQAQGEQDLGDVGREGNDAAGRSGQGKAIPWSSTTWPSRAAPDRPATSEPGMSDRATDWRARRRASRLLLPARDERDFGEARCGVLPDVHVGVEYALDVLPGDELGRRALGRRACRP